MKRAIISRVDGHINGLLSGPEIYRKRGVLGDQTEEVLPLSTIRAYSMVM